MYNKKTRIVQKLLSRAARERERETHATENETSMQQRNGNTECNGNTERNGNSKQ